jgi:protein TonB
MSKLSLYENNWINLVFETEREYGAFQLRQQSARTSWHIIVLHHW